MGKPERGCYRWAKEHFTALWIVANELPLRDELVPFLITRTGRPLREFVEWVIEKKSWPLVEDLVQLFPMLYQEMRENVKFDLSLLDDEAKRNIQSWIVSWLQDWPDFREALTKPAVESAVETTALREARDAVIRILQVRKLDVRPEQVAKIEACTNLDILHRWLDRTVTAISADEALTMD